jgi:hypothetical protein
VVDFQKTERRLVMCKNFFAVGLLLLMPFYGAFAQAGGAGNAMSPVGVWDFEVVDATGAVQKALVEFHFGGTATLTASASPYSSSYGTWEKTGNRTFVVSWYAIIADEVTGEHIGYVKSLVENTLVDKDTIEGHTEVWFLLGTDPSNPQQMFLILVTDDLGMRLRAEGPS